LRQVNTIRVYNVSPKINHDDCASIFNAVGIYMIIDVNSPLGGESINRADPASSYHSGYLSRIFGIVENFKGYPNTMAFFAANEVINDLGTVKDNPQYIRVSSRIILKTCDHW
jgi:1,3-beta-glucanosyltransferase GAS3